MRVNRGYPDFRETKIIDGCNVTREACDAEGVVHVHSARVFILTPRSKIHAYMQDVHSLADIYIYISPQAWRGHVFVSGYTT
jgi:hypothetical protein